MFCTRNPFLAPDRVTRDLKKYKINKNQYRAPLTPLPDSEAILTTIPPACVVEKEVHMSGTLEVTGMSPDESKQAGQSGDHAWGASSVIQMCCRPGGERGCL